MDTQSDTRNSLESSLRSDVLPRAVTDRVRWGPVLAGTVTALTALAILGTLGTAIGLSSYDRGQDQVRNFMIAGGIWGTISMVVAFALGGWVAVHSAGVYGRGNGLLNGALVAAVGIPLILFVLGSAATAMSSAELANSRDTQGRRDYNNANVAQANGGIASNSAAGGITEEARRDASKTAWSTFIAMVLAVAAAGIAGRMGSLDHRDGKAHMRGDPIPVNA